MAAVTLSPGTLTNYKNTSVQSGDTVYLGTGQYRIRLALELPKSLKSISGTVRFRASAGYSQGSGEFYAAMTQEDGNTPPDAADDSFYFSWDSNRGGSFDIVKRMKKGSWYLWLWHKFTDHQEILSGAKSNGYPIWDISGETAGAGHVYKNGAWVDVTPKVYRDGAWQDAAAVEYDGSWGELA